MCACLRTSLQSLQRNLELLFEGLANNTVKITALDLSRCGIDDATVVRLGNALKVCERSCLLIASSTLLLKTCKPRLAPPANHAFSIDFLQVNKHLTSLNMSGNKQITDKGWAEFAKGLAVSIRALFHPMAPKMSSRNRYQHAF